MVYFSFFFIFVKIRFNFTALCIFTLIYKSNITVSSYCSMFTAAFFLDYIKIAMKIKYTRVLWLCAIMYSQISPRGILCFHEKLLIPCSTFNTKLSPIEGKKKLAREITNLFTIVCPLAKLIEFLSDRLKSVYGYFSDMIRAL